MSTYDYAIINIKKQILKKKFLLEELCNSMKEKNKWMSVCLYLLSLLTGAISGIDYAIPEANIQIIATVLSIGTMILLKLKSYLNYDYIKELCKKQLVKYDLLFQKIERGITKHSYDQTDEEEFILCLYRELNVLENNDPEISNSIYDKFGDMCRKMNIPFNDTLHQLAELYGTRGHKPNKSYGSDLQKLSDLHQKQNADPLTDARTLQNTESKVTELTEIHLQRDRQNKGAEQTNKTSQNNEVEQNKSLQNAEQNAEPVSHVDDYAHSDVSLRTKRIADVFDLDYGQPAVALTSPKIKNWTLSRLKDL